jgi:hypothetical protein
MVFLSMGSIGTRLLFFVFLDFYFDNMIGSIVVWSGCFSRLEVIWDFHDFGLQPFCPDGLAFAQISSGL